MGDCPGSIQGPAVDGAVLISAADMARLGDMPRAARVQAASGNAETLVTTPEKMADELAGDVKSMTLSGTATGLASARPGAVVR